jgi:predicted adenine nucleotide alpha hydrolase (AANH) superfamily ATPase
MKLAKRRRPQDFKRRILKTGIATRKETYEEEQRWLQLIKESEIKTRYYNLNIRNNEIWLKYDENVKEISEKISINTKKAMQSPEVRKNYLKGLKKRNTKSSDPEVREKRRQSMRATMLSKHGHKWSAEKQLAFAAR